MQRPRYGVGIELYGSIYSPMGVFVAIFPSIHPPACLPGMWASLGLEHSAEFRCAPDQNHPALRLAEKLQSGHRPLKGLGMPKGPYGRHRPEAQRPELGDIATRNAAQCHQGDRARSQRLR